MKIIRDLMVVLSLFGATPVWADVEFKIVTDKGFVVFAAGEEWPMIAMQSKMPVTSSAFQIPNPADSDTPHSTNLVFMFYEHGSEKADSALEMVGKQYGPDSPVIEKFLEWEIFNQSVLQQDTTYVILDAKRDFEGVSASVRLAWPRLAENPSSYDGDMKRIFQNALRSVTEHVGVHVPAEDQVVRRRAK